MAIPIVRTETVSDTTPSSTELVGSLEWHGGKPTYVRFEWKPLGELAANQEQWGMITSRLTTPQGPFPGGTWFTEHIEPLVPGGQYAFRALAWNDDGNATGEWIRFWPAKPHKPNEGAPWMINETYQTWGILYLHWKCKTDIPCHLHMHVAHSKPKYRIGIHVKRGTVFHHRPYIDFNYREQIQQNEEGDTIQHTFNIPFPGYCHRRYWFVHGTVNGKESPSSSTIYYAHMTMPHLQCGATIGPYRVWGFASTETYALSFRTIDWFVIAAVSLSWVGSVYPLHNGEGWNYKIQKANAQNKPDGETITEGQYVYHGEPDPYPSSEITPLNVHWLDTNTLYFLIWEPINFLQYPRFWAINDVEGSNFCCQQNEFRWRHFYNTTEWIPWSVISPFHPYFALYNLELEKLI